MPAFGECSDLHGSNPNNCVTYNQRPNLTYNDFQIISSNDPRASSHGAFVVSDIISQSAFQPQGNGFCTFSIYSMNAIFDRSSSSIVEGYVNAKMLNHEQGHWDLTEYAVRATKAMMNQESDFARPCGDDPVAKAKEIVNSHLYTFQIESRYDTETQGSRDEVTQEQWVKKIDCLLKNPVPFSYCENLYPTPVKLDLSTQSSSFDIEKLLSKGNDLGVHSTDGSGLYEGFYVEYHTFFDVESSTSISESKVKQYLENAKSSFFIGDNTRFEIIKTDGYEVTMKVISNIDGKDYSYTQTHTVSELANGMPPYLVRIDSSEGDSIKTAFPDIPILKFWDTRTTDIGGIPIELIVFYGSTTDSLDGKTIDIGMLHMYDKKTGFMIGGHITVEENDQKLGSVGYGVINVGNVSTEFGGYSSWDTYCKAKYGDDQIYDSESDECVTEIDPIDNLLDTALDYLDQEKWNAALQIIDQALKLDPDNDEALLAKVITLDYIAMDYIDQEKFDEANQLLDQALKLNPDNDELLLELFVGKAFVLFELERYDEASLYVDKGFAIDPNQVSLLDIEYGINYLKTESVPEIITKSTQKVPDWVKNNARWWAEGTIGDADFIGGLQHLIKEEIITVTRQTVASDVTNEIPSWVKTQTEWWANGQITEEEFLNSVEYLMKQGIINLEDSNSQTASQLEVNIDNLISEAWKMIKNENFEQSLLNSEKILEIDPTNFDGLFIQGESLLGLQRYSEAAYVGGVGLEIYPDECNFINHKMAGESIIGNFEESLKYAEKAKILCQDMWWYYVVDGIISYNKSNLK